MNLKYNFLLTLSFYLKYKTVDIQNLVFVNIEIIFPKKLTISRIKWVKVSKESIYNLNKKHNQKNLLIKISVKNI